MGVSKQIKNSFLLLSLFSTFVLQGQKLTAFKIYNEKGKKVTFKRMIKDLSKQEIVLFGELHNNPIAHWIQLELIKELDKKRDLTLGAEMLETDNQSQLNQYLAQEIDQSGLDSLARLWNNYHTDYKPLVDFAKENKITFVATNIPRRYARMVYRKGFEVLDSLPSKEKQFIAPLPIAYDPELPGYKKMMKMMRGHSNPNFPKAQAIKDATMAHFILKKYYRPNLFIHFNGAYHSDFYDGIYWYLIQQNKNLKIKTISTTTEAEVKKLEDIHQKRASYTIVVDEDMTTSY
ncbi:ChaN family lipoprotein [Mesonia sp. HuA40]|uniref:ChaN family lipoprotein n=1 Tax=Mesonia sp. HuA40 TaxID=2602761 RepID=UPI0011C82E11|nr:ChaN family lipoprotein [Mesonia sp. HuA40]